MGTGGWEVDKFFKESPAFGKLIDGIRSTAKQIDGNLE